MGSNVQSHQCKMSKVAFSKADEHKKEMELFISPPWAITPVICISHHEKKHEHQLRKWHQFHIYTTYL